MRPRSLRARASLGAVAVVGAALLAGSVAVVVLTRSSLTGNVREAAELRAEDVVTTVELGGLAATDLAVEDEEDGFIQVVDAEGRVLAASENVAGEAAVADLADESSLVLDEAPVGTDRFVVVGLDAEGEDGSVLVLVGRALDGADEATRALIVSLAVIVPVVLLLVGLVAWRLVGRALQPVAELTRGAQAIADGGVPAHLPDTATADELAELSGTLNAMLDRLSASRDRLAAFVADAAHELRTPVSALRQHAEVAGLHPTATTVDDLADVVGRASLRLQALVDDLLVLARSDEGASAAGTTPVDLDDIVADVLIGLEGPPHVDRSRLSGGQVRGDAAALRRLVANLVDNARRHARDTLAVGVDEADGIVTLTVEDDGPGVPAPDRERVFERFVRLDEARARDAGGSGLGLAIVAAVVRDHGGEIALDTGGLGGARFRVRLPAS